MQVLHKEKVVVIMQELLILELEIKKEIIYLNMVDLIK